MRREPRYSVIEQADIGEGTVVHDHVNLYKCKIGRNCKISAYVYIEEGVVTGDNCERARFHVQTRKKRSIKLYNLHTQSKS